MYKKFIIPILLLFVVLAVSCKKNTIGFKNLDFETPCESIDSICEWQISYAVKSKFDFVKRHENNNDFALQITGNGGVGYVEQAFVIPKNDEERIFTFSAEIKTENLKGKGAGLTIGIYGEENILIQSVDMGYGDFNYVKKTVDWTTKTIETVVPKNANTIKIGLIAYGTGKAYFDNAEIKFIQIGDRRPSKLAKEYIDIAADSIMKNSLLKEKINIRSIKEKAYQIAGDAKNGKDTHLAIKYMLQSIEDNHAFFMPADVRNKWENTDNDKDKNSIQNIKLSNAELKGKYGYINIPGFHGNDINLKLAFADTIRKQIKNIQDKSIKGWIVDLRNNDGGNMHPMLAGLEPFFSSDTLGYLIDVNGKKEFWGRGIEFENKSPEDYIKPTIKTERITDLPIAVLYGNRTGSSGEIVIISFIGNTNTKSFGQQSYGLTTGNGEFMLPDGSYMLFSSTYMADRNGKVYKSSIFPDEVIKESDESLDKTLERAILYLESFEN